MRALVWRITETPCRGRTPFSALPRPSARSAVHRSRPQPGLMFPDEVLSGLPRRRSTHGLDRHANRPTQAALLPLACAALFFPGSGHAVSAVTSAAAAGHAPPEPGRIRRRRCQHPPTARTPGTVMVSQHKSRSAPIRLPCRSRPHSGVVHSQFRAAARGWRSLGRPVHPAPARPDFRAPIRGR